MNSDERRLLRHLESYSDNPNTYNPYYSSTPLWDRVIQPGFLLSLAFVAVFVYHHLSSQNTQLQPLPDLLWNSFVAITPARLLYAVDRWLNPPLFPTPMLQTQSRSTSHAAKSDVLRRVLGMDKPGGIMASVSQVGRRGLTTLSSSSPIGILKGDLEKPAGLGNISNSCYQNSVLQGLAALRPLRAYLASADAETSAAKTETSTVDTLRELVQDLNNTSNNGKTLWTPSILKNMSTWQQQDAQEYFSKLLDEIDREMARLLQPAQKPAGFDGEVFGSGKDDTASSQHSDDSGYQSLSNHSKAGSDIKTLRNPLEGLQAQRVACTACGHSDGLSMIPFNCLTLNLGTDGRDHNLFERLDSYTKVESIPGVECGKCTLLKYKKLVGKIVDMARAQGRTEAEMSEPLERLRAIDAALEDDDFDDETLVRKCKIKAEHKVSSLKTKQAVIARPPQSLVVHMNRSVFDETTGRMWKNLAAVRFPTMLDLGPWCLGSRRAEEGKEEQWLLDPNESMVAGGEGESRISGPMYELRAVVTHYGRHENGHYVCYRKHARPRRQDGGRESENGVEEKPAQLAGDRGSVGDVAGLAGLERQGMKADDAEQRQDDEGEESQWWRLSDQDVTKVDEETVLAQSGVFMLFYDCVDPNSTLASEAEDFVDSVSLQGTDGGAGAVPDTPETGISHPRVVEIGKEETVAPGPSPKSRTQRAPMDDRAERIARAKRLFEADWASACLTPLPDEGDHL